MKSVYLHVLQEDLLKFCYFWATYFPEFNVGSFSSSTGEHKNKCIKQELIRETNQSTNRMATLVRNNLIRIFHFTDALSTSVRENLKCSKCLNPGHQKNNRNCPKSASSGDTIAVRYLQFTTMTTDDSNYLKKQQGITMFYPPEDLDDNEDE